MPNRASGEGRIAATGREKGSKPDREKEKRKRDEDAKRERERERQKEGARKDAKVGRKERDPKYTCGSRRAENQSTRNNWY